MSAVTRPIITPSLTLLFAVACGAVVANLYYAQPLLPVIGRALHVQAGTAGLLVTVTQLGYALGLALLVPLGDSLDRRKLIVTLLVLTVLALLLAAFAPGFGMFALGSVLVGVTSCAAQVLLPFAASLAPDQLRGRVVGTVMSGLLLGILLARTFSGLLAGLAGWRAVYLVAAGLMVVLLLVLARALPGDRRETAALPYGQLLRSLLQLVAQEPTLRFRSLLGLLGFGAFSVLWTALAFLLSGPPYHYGEGVIGLFGLIGAAGALAASLAGRLADQGRGRLAVTLFSLCILVSFAFIGLGAHLLIPLILGIVLLDLGVQGLHVSNQGEIYRLRPEARARITTVYLTSYFLGGVLGSGAASLAWKLGGWAGVSGVGAVFGLLIVGLWTLSRRRAA